MIEKDFWGVVGVGRALFQPVLLGARVRTLPTQPLGLPQVFPPWDRVDINMRQKSANRSGFSSLTFRWPSRAWRMGGAQAAREPL